MGVKDYTWGIYVEGQGTKYVVISSLKGFVVPFGLIRQCQVKTSFCHATVDSKTLQYACSMTYADYVSLFALGCITQYYGPISLI